MVVAGLGAIVALAVGVAAALGASVTRVTVTGGTGTVTVGDTIHAKQGGTLTLTVTTSTDTRCVELTGAHTTKQTSSTAKGTWSFTLTAAAGDGVQTVTAAASPNFNQNNCTGQSQTPQSATYVLDNTGPTVTGTLSPAPNGAGWSREDVTVAWRATDVSDIASGPTPASQTQSQDTAGVERTATATDRLGNAGSGKVAIKLDKTRPSIDATRAPEPNAAGWNSSDVTVGFTCSDALSGIKSCTGGGNVTVSTEGAGQKVPGTAVDNADNTDTAGVTGINIDKTAPSLSGAPTTQPNAAGWYRDDVAIRWTASDALSGLAGSAPETSTLTGEGAGLTASASVHDVAGNRRAATSAPIRIDRTAPATSATAPTGWSRGDVSVTLHPDDALSGVATTSYQVDGGAVRTGTAVVIEGEGRHTLEFWSTDAAGNVEARTSVGVDIDATAPRIRHELDRAPDANGWFRRDVAVDFVCDDATSQIASCGPDTVLAEEGRDQDVAGRAVDHAGHTADDHAFISLDETDPTIEATADRAPNAGGWYREDVTVTATCADALSGVDTCTPAQVLGEGSAQTASATAVDTAGNSASTTVSGIRVDKTAPTLTGTTTPEANAAGWHRGDVTVAWTCADALSGLDATCPAEEVLTGEGSDVSASASVRDRAGNATHATVGGIRIDRASPATTARVDAPLPSGWYAGAVKVRLTATDGLSGVAATYYSVDGGPAQRYDGEVEVADKGRHTVAFWSVDKAGNVEDRTAPDHEIELKIDGIPPRISGSAYPLANTSGWNNTAVTVAFACSDAESGLDVSSGLAGCDPGTTFGDEGSALSYTGTARDLAGNTASATVGPIRIDRTAPTLSGAATAPPNAAGWYRDDVTVRWTGEDALSGIDPVRRPGDTVVTGEGGALVAGPVTVFDRADNPSVPASVSPIRIDRTAPVVTGGPTTQPNPAGWYRTAVAFTFACTDNLSGCAGKVDGKVLAGDGADQSVTSEPADDLAGNVAPGKTVGGIDIDSQAPQSAAAQQCDGKNGFCRGQSATVVLSATDQAGLSGVREIRYVVNGGQERTAPGASATVSVPLAARSGLASVRFWAVDEAGNVEAPNGVSLKYDNMAPTVTHTVTPPANAAGWNNAPLTAHFDAVDDDGGSGVDASTVTPDVEVSENTAAAGRVITGRASDMAGNEGTDSVTVRLDKTAPTITATVTGPQGAGGWYTGPVTVRFTCADALSTIAECPGEEVVTENGAGRSVTGSAVDKAGNTASYEVTGLDIDSTKPAIDVRGVADGGTYTLGAVPTAGCSATDNISPAVSCKVTVTGGKANGVGTFTYTASATDDAGNTATETGTYSVIYRWGGVLQPINDTAHQIGTNTSIFKAGSTVPTKFQLKRADGTPVAAGAAPVWLTPVKGSATTAAVDETLYTDAPTAGGLFRYDATAQQYHYNWGTPRAGGNYYRLGILLDDGRTYHVNIALR